MLHSQHRSLHNPPRMPFFAYGSQGHKSSLFTVRKVRKVDVIDTQ